MAQAVFEDHPLSAYLRQTGEDAMPGAMADLTAAEAESEEYAEEEGAEPLDLWGLVPEPVARLLLALLSEMYSGHDAARQAERFKYDIISSSLLAASISPPTSALDRCFAPDTPTVPGRDAEPPHPAHAHAHVPLPVLCLSVLALLSLLSGSITFTALFGSAVYYFYTHSANPARAADGLGPTLTTLNELITASNLWEQTVHDVHALIENEESSIYHASPTASSAPAASLRVALLSALQTTQSQCDNVRHLLSALTAPAALAQLSEMYAPPSPTRPALELLADPERPLTLPAARRRVASTPGEKRATWAGAPAGGMSYTALASAGSPSRRSLRRREKRRSDLSALLETSRPASASAPVTPEPNVVEEEEEEEAQEVTVEPAFGASALRLRRERRAGGMSSLGFPSAPPSASGSGASPVLSPPPTRHARSRAPSVSPSPASSRAHARFTSLHAPRHPLSLSALNHALAGAVAAKRYAAAHLLALRFEGADEDADGETDEQYWRDVRDVVGLFSSALAEAAARLTAALDADERARLRAQVPTPVHSPRPSLTLDGAPRRVSGPSNLASTSIAGANADFAPAPSEFARFAQHVDAIGGALADARAQLAACVDGLHVGDGGDGRAASLSGVPAHPAVQAYERLRRELGLALRECERGRARLLALVSPQSDCSDEGDGGEGEGVPPLASDDSDRAAARSPSPPTSPPPHDAHLHGDAVLVHGAPPAGALALGDVSAALEALLVVPAGIEAVFEAAPEDALALAPAAGKLPREERIRLARERREARAVEEVAGRGRAGRERWGPGEDVVDELRDVISKVGERRRRMVEAQARAEPPPPIAEPPGGAE